MKSKVYIGAHVSFKDSTEQLLGTVKDLIEKLSTFDNSMNVICYDDIQGNFLDILSINEVEAEKNRNIKGNASLKFTKSDASEKHLLIEVTTDF